MNYSFIKNIVFGLVFLSATSILADDRTELDRIIRSVQYAEVLFDQSGELAAVNELRSADSQLLYFDRDFDIHLARNEIDQAIFMLNDIYLTRNEKRVRLSRSIQEVIYKIRVSDTYNRPSQRSFIITCESPKKFPMRCDLGNSPVTQVQLVRQLSRSACISGRTWGVDFRNNKLWVSNGCRGSFQVFIR